MERSLWEPEGIDSVLGPAGTLAEEGAQAGIDLPKLWTQLLLARTADELFASLDLPRFAPSRGEEAIHACISLLLDSDDWIYPGSRDRVLPLLRGASIREMVAQLRHAEACETFGRLQDGGTTSQLAAVACPTRALGMHLPIATGHARAVQLTQSNAVIVTICGEGLGAHGRFHESLCLAASAQLPVVFIVKRPLWSQLPPPEAGVLGRGVLARAESTGVHALRSDGADCIGVYRSMESAIAHARAGKGPTLVEVSYTPLHEQSPEQRDPLHRMKIYLEQQGGVDTQSAQKARLDLRQDFQTAIAELARP